MALGLPAGISPPPRCGSDPRKKNPLPGSVFGRVWSCLVRCTSLLLAGLLRHLNWVSGITGSPLSIDLGRLTQRLEKAQRGFMTAGATWNAITASLPASSVTPMPSTRGQVPPMPSTHEPNLSGSYIPSDFLWNQASSQAFLRSHVDPA
jgi:hypothetical protein